MYKYIYMYVCMYVCTMESIIIEVGGIIALGRKNCKTNNSVVRKCLK